MNISTYKEEKRVNISLVTPKTVPLVWQQVERYLEKGKKYLEPYYTKEDLYQIVLAGEMQLWISFKNSRVRTIMLTQFDHFPRCVQFRYVFICGERGSFDEIVYAFKMVEEWAVEKGATKGSIIGRDGWEKIMEPLGYHKRSVVLVKDLKL